MIDYTKNPKQSGPVGSIDQVPDGNLVDEAGANRLRLAVAHGGGPAAVAARAGMPIGTLKNYLRGRDMKATALVALADATEVSLVWLATGRTSMFASQADATCNSKQLGENEHTPVKSSVFVPIPRYDVAASAGAGAAIEEETLVGYLALEEEFFRTVINRSRKNLVSMQADGDSMDPTIRDGDVLVVDTSVTKIENSRVYILEVRGNLLVKRIQLRLDGALIIKSDNPKYDPEVVMPSERNPLRIVGQVVYQAGPVRA